MINGSIFAEIANKNMIALCFFVYAKAAGMCGVVLGFSPDLHALGGVFIMSAFVAITACVTLTLLQLREDNRADDA